MCLFRFLIPVFWQGFFYGEYMSIDQKARDVMIELVSLGYTNPLIYGSWTDYFNYEYDSKYPNDIDVINIVYDELISGEVSLTLKSIDIPVNVQNMTNDQFRLELSRGDMKYYNIYPLIDAKISNTTVYHARIGGYITKKSPALIREQGSNASSKAFNKGKKKLTVLEDFDKVLGLKNIWHSINFPYQIMRWFDRFEVETTHQFEVNRFKEEVKNIELIEIRDRIYEIYESTEGNYLQKAEAVMAFAKPIQRAYMTEFRKRFPKD